MKGVVLYYTTNENVYYEWKLFTFNNWMKLLFCLIALPSSIRQ